MKESVTSLRLYFLAVGLLTLWGTGLWGIAMGAGTFVNPLDGTEVALPLAVLNIVLAAGFLYFAATLPAQVKSGRSMLLKAFIVIEVLAFAVTYVLDYRSGAIGLAEAAIGIVIPALVGWYLYQAVARLSVRK